MRRIQVASVLIVLFVVATGWVTFTQTAKPPGPLRTERVRDNLYMISGEGGNVAVYVTDEGVVLVDDMFDRNHADILAQVKALTPAPIRYVINTHQHDDHAGGDLTMLPIAEVIAHKNVRANLADLKQPYYEDTPGTPIGLPRLTFSDEMSVHLGGQEVQAHYFGRGHTSGDAVIAFPRVKAIHTGDLFLSQRPTGRGGAAAPRLALPIYVDSAQGGSLLEWAHTLDGVLALDFDVVIPGHGSVATRADIAKFRADVAAMQTRMQGLVRQGASRADVVKVLEDDYGWRAKGCPPSPPTPGCLQYQQVDALIAELKAPPARAASGAGNGSAVAGRGRVP